MTLSMDAFRSRIASPRSAGKPFTKSMGALPAGSLMLPESYGRRAFMAQLFKGAGHKYIKRVPTGKFTKTGKPRYRYYYHAAKGGGVGSHEHMVHGAGFRADGGHWHIVAADGDTLTVKHDETGESRTTTKAELAAKLHGEHKASLAEHAKAQAERLERDRAEAREHGTDKHRKRLGLPTKAEEEAAKKPAQEEPKPAEKKPRKKAEKKPKEPSAEPGEGKPRGEHHRVGDHVAGARRDLQGLTFEQILNLAPDERKRLLTKASIHKALSADDAKAQGWSAGAHALYKTLFASVLATPPVPREQPDQDEERRKLQGHWIEGITFLSKKLEAAKGSLKSMVAALQEIEDALEAERKQAGDYAPDAVVMFPDSKKAMYGLRSPNLPMSLRLNALGRQLRDMVEIATMASNGFRSSGWKFGQVKAVLAAFRAEKDGWPKAEEGATGAEKSEAKPSRERFIFARLTKDKPERKGGRPLPAPTADALRDEFGFHEVDFGNWVSQEDREHHLKWCHASFRDLEDVLGLPKGIAALQKLGGKSGRNPLAVAFGARGKGKALAHYEAFARDEKTGTITPTINLTRYGGGGSLAHEWGHYLDNVLAEAARGPGKHPESAWVSHLSSTFGTTKHLPPDLAAAAKELMSTIRTSDFARDATGIGSKYWSEPHELFARAFEAYVEDKLEAKGMGNSYLVAGTRDSYGTKTKVRRTEAELAHLEPGYAGKLEGLRAQLVAAQGKLSDAATDGTRDFYQSVVVPLERKGHHKKAAVEYQRARDEWKRTHGANLQAEVENARKAAAEYRREVATKHGDRFVQPYPQPHERKKLSKAFDQLFDVIAKGNHLEKALRKLATMLMKAST